MRQIVRRSRVHIINKLSREAKKLKEKKGSEEQVIKNKKKAERFINELMAMKVCLKFVRYILLDNYFKVFIF